MIHAFENKIYDQHMKSIPKLLVYYCSSSEENFPKGKSELRQINHPQDSIPLRTRHVAPMFESVMPLEILKSRIVFKMLYKHNNLYILPKKTEQDSTTSPSSQLQFEKQQTFSLNMLHSRKGNALDENGSIRLEKILH